MLPFDSTFFFNDPFFESKSVTWTSGVNTGKTVQGIDVSKLSPAKMGKLQDRPGDWTLWNFLTADISRPQNPDTFTVGSVTWYVDSTDPSGDVYEVLAFSNQRKHE